MDPMDIVWELPPQNFVKINVHAAYRADTLPNGNNSGIGVVIRNHEGNIIRMITGTIKGLTRENNQLWAMLKALQRVCIENLTHYILETDDRNMINIIDHYMEGGVGDQFELAHQIIHIIKDQRFVSDFELVDSNRNILATYLARNGGETRDRLYVVTEPFGRVQEIQNFDLGLAPLEQPFWEDEDDYHEELDDADDYEELDDARSYDE
ncbi:hypothetical protein POM88_036294 [Heracleum sosnowskyi]|uniref:RNase H type-1 domain-containing protein n=1 Tax=Heracleum sosnowskyi TaxID=360622 RepID=A0AAD8MER6_9APIA|nr:hypothetical protein POM88_036290 [Heracleum sosnowskyi]KAK1370202.1 hypothetical protein POM88_036294 [Heracleum sosnowskyi]